MVREILSFLVCSLPMVVKIVKRYKKLIYTNIYIRKWGRNNIKGVNYDKYSIQQTQYDDCKIIKVNVYYKKNES